MYNIAKASEQDRRVLFRNTAQQTGLHEAIIEKDFWVCLTLDHLFHHSPWKAAFTFKGGTSLSKCYGLIQRFSEDIDLILDWRVLGYGLHEPWAPRSNTKQDQFNKEANERAEQFLRDILLPSLRSEFGIILGMEADLYIDPDDEQTICFRYPSIFKTESILQVIRLEIGALAAWTPSQPREIRPYSAECYRAAFQQANTVVLTAAAERTFWEKVTILHHEANRPEHLPMPSRYSRHYYDLYCIAHSESKAAAYEDLDLLGRVVEFKMKFYPRKWAQYELARPGTMKLCPPEYRYAALEEDYAVMQGMMFGEGPSFADLMAFIRELEAEINAL